MSALTLRTVCFGLALFGLAPQAQTVVRLDPLIPIAGEIPRALVTFEGTNPSSVTVQVREVGTTAFQAFTATDEGDNTWAVELPFEMPAQGLDVYAQYVVDGQTISEPTENPDLFPYRVPALSLNARPGTALPARQYRMVTVPFHLDPFSGVPVPLGSSEPLDVFGDDFGASGDPTLWRVLRWNPSPQCLLTPSTECYRDAVLDNFDPVIRPGRGFWIITANGGSFDVERGLSTGFTLDGDRSFIITESITLQPGWNQIGNPFLFPIQWTDVVGSERVEDPIGFQGTYSTPQATLRPWEGYFVFSPNQSPVTLRFSALPPLATRTVPALVQRMQARAGGNAAVLSVTVESGHHSDEIYLGLAETLPSSGRPVNLRKPPPVDGGLRLAVQDAGEDWIGRFHQLENARWTIAITLPTSDDATLRLHTAGDWPDGLVIDDLDRGVELAITEGTVSVPALSNTPTRRLQIRVGNASSLPEAPSLAPPWPNPSASVVTIPYMLGAPGPVRLSVLDVLGRTVRVLYDEDQEAGAHTLLWDGLDALGQPVAAGTYLVRLDAGDRSATNRVTRLR